jgi:hypothetical protein
MPFRAPQPVQTSALDYLTRLVRKSARDHPDILPDHIDVAGSRTILLGQAIRIKRSADRSPRLGGNFAHQSGIGDVFQEDHWNFLFVDLRDDACDVPCTRFGFGRSALGRNERDVIGEGEITEGVVS